MLNNQYWIRIGGVVWFALVATFVALRLASGASLSSSGLIFVMAVAPLGVGLLIGFGGPPPTVGEMLYAVNAEKKERA